MEASLDSCSSKHLCLSPSSGVREAGLLLRDLEKAVENRLQPLVLDPPGSRATNWLQSIRTLRLSSRGSRGLTTPHSPHPLWLQDSCSASLKTKCWKRGSFSLSSPLDFQWWGVLLAQPQACFGPSPFWRPAPQTLVLASVLGSDVGPRN